MSSSRIGIDLRYRPLRLGVCIRPDCLDDMRAAVRLNHALWGGRYNPLIPVRNVDEASHLARVHRVDALYPVYDNPISPDDETLQNLFEELSYLHWPFPASGGNLYRRLPHGERLILLTVTHAISKLSTRIEEDPPDSLPVLYHPEIDSEDPLSDLFLVTVGDYPSVEDDRKDFHTEIDSALGTAASQPHIVPEHQWENFLIGYHTPGTLTGIGLRIQGIRSPFAGLYLGRSNRIDDLINYWNLRALGNDLVFFDPAYPERLGGLAKEQLNRVEETYTTDPQNSGEKRLGQPTAWTSDPASVDEDEALQALDRETLPPKSIYRIERFPQSSSPEVFCAGSEESVLASVSQERGKVQVALQLPNLPIDSPPKVGHYIASVQPQLTATLPQNRTLRVPNIPELGEYVGRAFRPIDWSIVEKDRIGAMSRIDEGHMTLRPSRVRAVVSQLLALVDIDSTPSKEGRVVKRLIDQMGGLQACRAFKLEGVRALIGKHGPRDSVTRGQAEREIGEFEPGGHPDLERYSDIYVEPRRSAADLGPSRIFDHLIEREVFQAGVEIECPNCRLDQWRSVNDLRSDLTCEYCGVQFSPTQKLDDLDWRYRRSGLFGRDDNQGGGIPVALTLMQLDTVLSSNWSVFVTGTEMSLPSGRDCESDFVLLTQARAAHKKHRPQAVLSECKSHHPIEESDVDGLQSVGERLRSELDIDVYYSFSKLGEFSTEELDRFRSLRKDYRGQVIILSKRELEPHRVFSRTSEEFEVRPPVSLRDLAQRTSSVYLDQRSDSD